MGAGLSGLAAALRLVEAGCPVIVREAARHAGARCRSYHDPQIGMTVDIGNHLALSRRSRLRARSGRRGLALRVGDRMPFCDSRLGTQHVVTLEDRSGIAKALLASGAEEVLRSLDVDIPAVPPEV